MNPLVSPSWLQTRIASRLQQPSLIILDATLPPVGVSPAPDVRARYLAEHIPGALYFDIEEFSDHATTLPHMLPSPAEFAAKASALGIDSNAEIVIYEQAGVFSAPRAWWTLRVFGAAHVHILDGGLRAWLAAGLPVESGPVTAPHGLFDATLNHGAVKSFPEIQQMLTQQPQILDARSAGRFSGTTPEPRPGLSSGHMPGAVSVPFTELVEQGSLKPVAQLRELFAAKGVDLTQPIITTCGSGVTAAVISLALEIAGAEHTSLYDGSWAEYASRPEAVIEKAE